MDIGVELLMLSALLRLTELRGQHETFKVNQLFHLHFPGK